jgi:predicted aspartyl protease
MESTTMGQVLVKVKVENIGDSLLAQTGQLASDKIRSLEVEDAVVDTGAKLLSLPTLLIRQLGLERFETRQARTSAGLVPCEIYRAVWLTVQGRRCTVDVAEVNDDCPVLIGYVPLELLDFVVDPVQRQLVGNPQHGGQQILDLL